ncbi:hypothetical protein KCU87_g399, partial [Aureobasidium melanogenum]
MMEPHNTLRCYPQHGATLLSTGLACRRIVGASRDVADGVDEGTMGRMLMPSDCSSVGNTRMPQQRLRGTLWPRLGTLTRLPSEVKDRVGPLVIILDHNGVPQSLGSRREDKLTWSNLTGASNNKGTLLDKREQQLSWCFDAPSYHLASPGHEELPVDVIQADPHIFSDILRNEETAQICLNFSSDGYPCV